jgi:hypothetical protein
VPECCNVLVTDDLAQPYRRGRVVWWQLAAEGVCANYTQVWQTLDGTRALVTDLKAVQADTWTPPAAVPDIDNGPGSATTVGLTMGSSEQLRLAA